MGGNINQELQDYISGAVGRGMSPQEIKSSLLGAGWDPNQVEAALSTPRDGERLETSSPKQDIATTPAIHSSPPPVATSPQPLRDFPDELRGWNWGAFFLGFIWGFFNRVWSSFLTLIPAISLLLFVFDINFIWIVIWLWVINIVFGLLIPIILGLKGNEWAWKKRRFRDIEEFKAVQKAWSRWAWGIILASILIISGLVILNLNNARQQAESTWKNNQAGTSSATTGNTNNGTGFVGSQFVNYGGNRLAQIITPTNGSTPTEFLVEPDSTSATGLTLSVRRLSSASDIANGIELISVPGRIRGASIIFDLNSKLTLTAGEVYAFWIEQTEFGAAVQLLTVANTTADMALFIQKDYLSNNQAKWVDTNAKLNYSLL